MPERMMGADADMVNIGQLRAAEAKIERLLAALEPFQRNVEALSLSKALGHIGREELWNARNAYKATTPPPGSAAG